MIRVVVTGAAGGVGREVVRAVAKAPDLELVGCVGRHAGVGQDAGEVAGVGPLGVRIAGELNRVLEEVEADVGVDFTRPDTVMENIHTYLSHGVRPVVGTTGLSEADLREIEETASNLGLGVVVAPNFAVGAVLMMRFARIAAQFFPQAEIIELHHERKVDAPSGTALRTAELIVEGWKAERRNMPVPLAEQYEKLAGARGGDFEGVRLHSVRLPGLVAHQEVIFGLPGQILTLRHDSTSRESFVPGVLLAIREVLHRPGLSYGLESLLFKD